MNIINTLSEGYKDIPKHKNPTNKLSNPIKNIEIQPLIELIKKLYGDEKINNKDILSLINQLQEFLNLNEEKLTKDLIELEYKSNILREKVDNYKSEILDISKDKEVLNTLKILEEFLGKEQIEKIKNLHKNV